MNKVTIIAYHYVRDLAHSRYPEIKGLDVKLFQQQVEFVKREFNPITMEELIQAIEGHYTLPEKAALFTFDDGYIDHFTNAFAILKNEKVQGSFFIPGKTWVEHELLDVNKIHFIMASVSEARLFQKLTQKMDFYRGAEYEYPSNEELFAEFGKPSRYDSAQTRFIKRMLQTALPEELRVKITSDLFKEFVGIDEEVFARELYLNREQIKCMQQNGMYIGLHGYDHYHNGRLETDKMIQDMNRALEAMADFVDPTSWVMNYPYGSYNDDVIEYIAKKGCKAGLTVNPAIADLSKDNPYTLPRLDTNDLPPKSENYRNYE